MWLTHCYGMVGVGRDVALDSGNGGEMYVVIGHAPRHLDLNVTLGWQGRPGDRGSLDPSTRYGATRLLRRPRAVRRDRFTAPRQRSAPMPTGKTWRSSAPTQPTFKALIESRRNRHESWFASPTGPHRALQCAPCPCGQSAEELSLPSRISLSWWILQVGLGHLLDVGEVADHLAPAVPQRVVGVGVERSLERPHAVLQMHLEQALLDRRRGIVERQQVGERVGVAFGLLSVPSA